MGWLYISCNTYTDKAEFSVYKRRQQQSRCKDGVAGRTVLFPRQNLDLDPVLLLTTLFLLRFHSNWFSLKKKIKRLWYNLYIYKVMRWLLCTETKSRIQTFIRTNPCLHPRSSSCLHKNNRIKKSSNNSSIHKKKYFIVKALSIY